MSTTLFSLIKGFSSAKLRKQRNRVCGKPPPPERTPAAGSKAYILFATAQTLSLFLTPRLLTTVAFPPIQDTLGGHAAFRLSLTSVHPTCSRRLGRLAFFTPRLLTTPGFPPIRNKTGRLRPPGFYSSLQSIRAVRDGSDA